MKQPETLIQSRNVTFFLALQKNKFLASLWSSVAAVLELKQIFHIQGGSRLVERRAFQFPRLEHQTKFAYLFCKHECLAPETFFKNCNMIEAIKARSFFTGVVGLSAKIVNGCNSRVIQQIKAPPSHTLPHSPTGKENPIKSGGMKMECTHLRG